MNDVMRRMLEGRARWGTLDVTPASPGLWQRVRLTVYPPGITRGERRLLHLRHGWPVAGAIAGLVLMVALSDAGPVLSLAAALTVYLSGFVVLARLTRELRSRSRVVTVASEYVRGELHEFGDVRLLRAAASRLIELDARRRAGLVDPVAYESAWIDVYETLPGGAALTTGGRGRAIRRR
ncbi:DUF6611 family protein [Leifsonia sp. C5G2]|uniref:DUF6611 family protein n=1 Tax=Leifsonia sp. C5G2 TaxID=2735269 RepID=UPI00158471A0|nr:hypothetical protein [Leifsonia sp. C5G2]